MSTEKHALSHQLQRLTLCLHPTQTLTHSYAQGQEGRRGDPSTPTLPKQTFILIPLVSNQGQWGWVKKSGLQEFTQAQIKRCEGGCQTHLEPRPRLQTGHGEAAAEKREKTLLVVGDRNRPVSGACRALQEGLGPECRHMHESRRSQPYVRSFRKKNCSAAKGRGFPGSADPTFSIVQR